MLKIDFHTHCNEDPEDRFIKHSPEELIDHAASIGFNALSITCHNKVVFSRSLQKYANLRNKQEASTPGRYYPGYVRTQTPQTIDLNALGNLLSGLLYKYPSLSPTLYGIKLELNNKT